MDFFDIYNSIKYFCGDIDSLMLTFNNQISKEKLEELLKYYSSIDYEDAMNKVILKNKEKFAEYMDSYLKKENKDSSYFMQSELYKNHPFFSNDITEIERKKYFFEFVGDVEKVNDPFYKDVIIKRIFSSFIYNTDYELEYDYYCECLAIQTVKEWCDKNDIKYNHFNDSRKDIIACGDYNKSIEIKYKDSKMRNYKEIFGLDISNDERCFHFVFKEYDDEYIDEDVYISGKLYEQLKQVARESGLFVRKNEIDLEVRKYVSDYKYIFDYTYSELYMIYNKTLGTYNKIGFCNKRQEILIMSFDDREERIFFKNVFINK